MSQNFIKNCFISLHIGLAKKFVRVFNGKPCIFWDFFFFISTLFYLFIYFSYIFKIYLFIYFWLCWVLASVRAFSSCGKWGPLFIAVRGPLTIMASLVAEHRLQTRRLSSCGPRAQPLRGMWDPPRPGPEPVSPALAGRLSTTAPPGKPFLRVLTDPRMSIWRKGNSRDGRLWQWKLRNKKWFLIFNIFSRYW